MPNRFHTENFKRRNTRRAKFHDYSLPGSYLITITAESCRPKFSHIDTPSGLVTLTPLGLCIAAELEKLSDFHHFMSIRERIIMPDHLHFILSVNQKLPKDIGCYIAGFKGACSKAWWAQNPQATGIPLYIRGFNDRIIWDDKHLGTATNYILDNPRRLCIKRKRPDLFRRYNHIRIGDKEFAAYGNLFLLRDFDRQQVVVHRTDSLEERTEKERKWTMCAANGGVLVSPFISPHEKAIRDTAIALGGNLIIIKNTGFEEKFKPQGNEFNLCSEGRLLLIAPWPEQIGKTILSRDEALKMNELAAYLCGCNDGMAIIG